MSSDDIAQSRRQLVEASARMVQALQILDEVECPGEIGSHLDLANARIEERLWLLDAAASIEPLMNGFAVEPLPSPERCSEPPSPWDIPPV